VELDVFGTVELEQSWKNGSRAVPNTPLIPPLSVLVFLSTSARSQLPFQPSPTLPNRATAHARPGPSPPPPNPNPSPNRPSGPPAAGGGRHGGRGARRRGRLRGRGGAHGHPRRVHRGRRGRGAGTAPSSPLARWISIRAVLVFTLLLRFLSGDGNPPL
jgi:hypothetical protein